MNLIHVSASHPRPIVHRADLLQPWEWLRLGYRDFRRAAADALLYGVAFVLMGLWLTFYLADAPVVAITLATLFLLAGPFLAIGLFDLARQMESFDGRGKARLMHSLTAWRANLPALTLYAALLTMLVFAWFRLSLLMFALFFDAATLVSLDSLLGSLQQPGNFGFLLAYFGLGFLFAAVVFAVSAVSIPMMLDQDVDTFTAMVASVQAVYHNLLTMALWAVMIVALTAVGFATYFVGLIIIMPVIALASWHAYRALITFER